MNGKFCICNKAAEQFARVMAVRKHMRPLTTFSSKTFPYRRPLNDSPLRRNGGSKNTR